MTEQLIGDYTTDAMLDLSDYEADDGAVCPTTCPDGYYWTAAMDGSSGDPGIDDLSGGPSGLRGASFRNVRVHRCQFHINCF